MVQSPHLVTFKGSVLHRTNTFFFTIQAILKRILICIYFVLIYDHKVADLSPNFDKIRRYLEKCTHRAIFQEALKVKLRKIRISRGI